MTGNDFQNQIDFNEKLTVGQVVEARWTNSYSAYACEAEVVKVNTKSLRVKLLKNHGPYLAGHIIVLPTLFDMRKWSQNNCAAPWGRYFVKCDDCRKEMSRTDSVRESAEGGRCDECRRTAVA